MTRAVRSFVTAAILSAAGLAFNPASYADTGRVITVQANPELQKRADALFKDAIAGGAKVTWGSLEGGASPEALTMKTISITSPDNKTVTIESLEVRAYDWANLKEPRYADMSVKGVLIKPDSLDKEGADSLKEYGFDELKLNADLTYKLDDSEKVFDVSKLVIDVQDFGELRLRLKLTGLTLADIKGAAGDQPKPGTPPAGDQGVMGLLARLNVAGASIGYKDKGGIDRAIAAEAKKKQMTAAAAKAKMLEDLAAEKSKAEDDVTRELIDAAIKFVTKPGEIELAAAPPAPANVMMAFMTVMGNRATFKQMMGLSVAVK